MNKQQTKLIEVLEKHLAQQISLEEMDTWLVENIRSTINPRLGGLRKPGLALEFYAYRVIRSYISDIDPTISQRADLKWYWAEVRRVIELLSGNRPYQESYSQIEHPLEHNLRKYDKWMLPYLEYAEKSFQELVTSYETDREANLPELNLALESKPLSLQTSTEIMMREMLRIIEDVRLMVEHQSQHTISSDRVIFQVNYLEKLIKCFKGELYYSVTVTFEGLDKFAVTVIIL